MAPSSTPSSNIARRRQLALREGNAAYLEKRAQVIAAATHLFKQDGFEQTSLNDIAEAVGIDRASIYYYYSSKSQILEEIVASVTGRNLQATRDLRHVDLPASERVVLFITHTLRFYHDNYPEVFVYIQEDMTRLSRRTDKWAKALLAQARDFEQALLDLIADGVNEGAFRPDLDPALVAHGLWGMINWTHRWYRPGHVDPDEVARVFAEIFLRGFERSRAPGEREPD